MVDDASGKRVVVVGPCAAGKTTLSNNLRTRGYNISVCCQEHSYVPDLWKTFSRADLLIYLGAELETIARRQERTDWTQARLDEQRRRLAHARRHCDLYVRTDDLTRQQVADAAEGFLRGRGIVPSRGRAG